MATINVGEVYKALGRLEEATSNLVEDIKDVKENQEEAKQSRDVINNQMAAMLTRMDAFDKQLKVVTIVTDDVTRWKQMGIGALAVTGFGASALTAIIMHYSTQLIDLLARKIGG